MLTSERIKDIEAIAADVLSTLGDPREVPFPVPLSKIAQNYSLTIKVVEFPDDSISGAFDRSRKVIYISKNEPLPRQAFTIAHELGHAILHKEKENEILYRKDVSDLDTESLLIEQEANWFAASLLMPRHKVELYSKVLDDPNLLAMAFGVSPSAMRFRMKHLGLLK